MRIVHFWYFAPFRNQSALEATGVKKIEEKFRTFDSCKIRREVGEMSEWIFRARFMTQPRLNERRWTVLEIRGRLVKKKNTRAKHKGLPTYVGRP